MRHTLVFASSQDVISDLSVVSTTSVIVLHRVVLCRDQNAGRLRGEFLHHRPWEDRRAGKVACDEELPAAYRFSSQYFHPRNRDNLFHQQDNQRFC